MRSVTKMWQLLVLLLAQVCDVASHAAPASAYHIRVLDRSLTSQPLLEYNRTSFAQNTLNPSWLPLPGQGHEGGGIFFRTITAPGTPGYNAVGFLKAEDAAGLRFPRAELSDILRDREAANGTGEMIMNRGADPRAAHRPATGEYFVTYQDDDPAYPGGRHTFISRTKTPLDAASWRRFPRPMLAGLQDGKTRRPFLTAAMLTTCNASDPTQRWSAGSRGTSTVYEHGATQGQCLSIRPSKDPDPTLSIGLRACAEATHWAYEQTKQLKANDDAAGGSSTGLCLDVDHGHGPNIGLYACHAAKDRDVSHQQFAMQKVEGTSEILVRSVSSKGGCLTVQTTIPNDSATVLWFPMDGELQNDASTASLPRAYAVVTLGELRGGNLSLASSVDLETWRFEGEFLWTRPDRWDNATLSAGPAPVRLEDGNWLLLYNVDQLWPVDHPNPLPAFGRCALGWAILDQRNLTHVLARAEEPLVHAELPWERDGFTPLVVYSDGIKPEGKNVFTVYAGGGDRVVEAFRIQVQGPSTDTPIMV
eukprot:gnl/TRDRNA2_/TRDRNA2_30165_c0_seq1.p1 gnl/TRDRNA2_/TRDRNA2_30165_c0~~gnl/TRDRNA2_/TRDRNA2_30165_c0_seq1.p1  ORF type:complete len:533 (+),score=71.10 gnl/TRDRNA2_/TRDRNA2_30165_c0_seq1:1-1599(+)